MTKSRVLTIIAAAAAGLILVIFLIGPEKRVLTRGVRESSGSQFLRLPEGDTEYEIAGPEAGEPVILVHGMSVPMFDWDSQFEALASAGYRVLRYNQFGRGLSDRPRGRYDASRYVRQLTGVMESQGWDRAHLVVHSMGAAVAAEMAQVHPESIRSLVLISPVYHMADGNSGIALIRLPLVGGLMARTALSGLLASRADELFRGAGIPEAETYSGLFRDQTRYFGFSRSVKSLFRHNMVDSLSEAYGEVDGNRTLLIWGTRDESVPRAHIEAIRERVPGMETVILEGIGHSPNLEVPERVNALILDFLAGE